MPISFVDPGLSNVRLLNGYEARESPEGNSLRYANLDGLLKAIACALVRKPARLDSGEFRWLRRYIGVSQSTLAEIIGKDAQTVSLIERGKLPPALIDRELRRLAIEQLDLGAQAAVPLLEMVARTKALATTSYYGRLHNDSWDFTIVASTPKKATVSQHVRSAPSFQDNWAILNDIVHNALVTVSRRNDEVMSESVFQADMAFQSPAGVRGFKAHLTTRAASDRIVPLEQDYAQA